MLARYFTDTTGPTYVRAAGLLYLLIAMPIARIVTLTRNDFVVEDEVAQVRNDRGLVPLPAQLGILIDNQFEVSQHRNTSAHDQSATWLFSGRRPGQHLNASSMRDRLRRHGLPRLRPGRHSAVAAFVAELSAPLAADVANLHPKTTAKWIADRAYDRSGDARRGL